MKIMVWDEIGMIWGEFELPIPKDTKDPKIINNALGEAIAGTDPLDEDDDQTSPDGWEVKSHSFTGPILTIETRSDINHLAIIIVNYEDQ